MSFLLRCFSLGRNLLFNLFESDAADGKEFRSNTRQYNMALAFTSLGVTEDKNINRRGGWVFRIHGELCHLIGSLRPDEDDVPSYAQLYIYDARMVLAQRQDRNNNLSPRTMQSLQTMLLNSHPYANILKHAYEGLYSYLSSASPFRFPPLSFIITPLLCTAAPPLYIGCVVNGTS